MSYQIYDQSFCGQMCLWFLQTVDTRELKSSTRCCEISVLNVFHVADAYGKSIVLAANYFPIIDLNDGDYEFGLAIFEMYHIIPNVNEPNNK